MRVNFFGTMRLGLGLMLSLCLPLEALAQADAPAAAELASQLEQGRRIYTEGVLPSGAELKGQRAGRAPVTGTAAACVNCHRPSGMGHVEAELLVPPITGNFLFAKREDRRVATMDRHVSKLFNQAHEPYSDASLAIAIGRGVNSQGREMSVVMPRFNLSEPELQALTAYLKQLSLHWSPGVSETNIRFATVITPDVDPAKRQVFIDMMQTIVRQKNSSTMTAVPTAVQSRTRHHMTTAAELMLGTERTWDLDIWELQGAPDTWAAQLTAFYLKQPVFALVSGLSAGNWQPVHDFCAREQVPCWFPSTEVPGRSQSAYGLYFSEGVRLEAKAMAQYLRAQKHRPKNVIQIYQDGALGMAAAQALHEALSGSQISVSDFVLRADMPLPEALRLAMLARTGDDALMFWLRPEAIATLAQIKPVSAQSYFSGLLAQGEHAPLPPEWRARSLMVYPYELPENRPKNLDYFKVWMNLKKIPMIDEAMQSEVFFSMNFMTDMLSEMLDNVYRDYLVERAETMLSKREGAKSEQETRDRIALGRVGDLTRKRGVSTIEEASRIKIQDHQGGAARSEGTTIYPHLSLAPNQRFASKSAYIVRFSGEIGSGLVAQSDLIVP